MSNQDARFEIALDDCLASLRSGRASVDECLNRHPEHAAGLAPLLRVAASLQAEAHPALSDAARQRIQTRLLDHVQQLPPRREAAQAPARQPLFGLLRWASTVALTVLLMTLLTGGAIRASDSLPGDPFYSVKSIQEQVETWLTPPSNLADMHLKFAERRLVEVMHQGHLGIVDDLAIIRMESEMRQVMELLPTLPQAKQREIAVQMLKLSQRQQTVLTAATYYTPRVSHAGLEWGIDTARRRSALLQEMLDQPQAK